jgi:hypothetical protein
MLVQGDLLELFQLVIFDLNQLFLIGKNIEYKNFVTKKSIAFKEDYQRDHLQCFNHIFQLRNRL